MCTLYNGWSEVKTLLQKIASTRECSNATTSHHLVLTLSLTFAIQGHSCEGSTSTLNWNLALAESVIPHSGWMSRIKEWLSTSGGVKPSTASVKMESPCRKWGQDMYTGFPAWSHGMISSELRMCSDSCLRSASVRVRTNGDWEVYAGDIPGGRGTQLQGQRPLRGGRTGHGSNRSCQVQTGESAGCHKFYFSILKISQRYKDCTICVYEEAQKKAFVSR